MDKIKNLIIMISGVCLSFISVDIINYLSEEFFQYLVPLPMMVILFVGICFLLEKIPFFGNSKIVLFEKKKNEKE
tara:strand:+ start:122 stop:346 length:225 start_codon:yes stop_codon:yes gene_type:complete